MTERSNLSEDLDLLAAEYALGLADEADRRRAYALLAKDAEFAHRVMQWREYGAGWLEEVEGEPVGDNVWQSLAPLFDNASVPANDTAKPDGVSMDATAWEAQAQVWRNRSYLAMAASLALVVLLGAVLMLGTRPQGTGQSGEAPPIAGSEGPAELALRTLAVAQIPSAEGVPLISAAFDPDQGALRLRVAEFDTGDKAPELWVLDETGTPVSLGLVEGRELTVDLSAELRALLVAGAIIAVTLEDREGAPHDAPSGAILGTGQLVIL